MSDINYKVEEKGDFLILRMEGVINAQTLPQYRGIVDSLMTKYDVANKDNLKFIMDYAAIGDVDSATLANILDRLKNDVRSDHKVAFINVPEKFKSLLTLFKVGDAIRVYDSQEEAERELSS